MFASGEVDSIALIRTIVRPRRFSSDPTLAARSARDGSCPNSRLSSSRAASSSRRWRRTPRGQASLRSASIMAPRMRRSANVSNLMPRASSKRCAASMSPMTPSWTRSPMSIEWGIVAATRRASCSTKGMLAITRGFSETNLGAHECDLRRHVRQPRYQRDESARIPVQSRDATRSKSLFPQATWMRVIRRCPRHAAGVEIARKSPNH